MRVSQILTALSIERLEQKMDDILSGRNTGERIKNVTIGGVSVYQSDMGPAYCLPVSYETEGVPKK